MSFAQPDSYSGRGATAGSRPRGVTRVPLDDLLEVLLVLGRVEVVRLDGLEVAVHQGAADLALAHAGHTAAQHLERVDLAHDLRGAETGSVARLARRGVQRRRPHDLHPGLTLLARLALHLQLLELAEGILGARNLVLGGLLQLVELHQLGAQNLHVGGDLRRRTPLSHDVPPSGSSPRAAARGES
jgi:hypothetical protein